MHSRCFRSASQAASSRNSVSRAKSEYESAQASVYAFQQQIAQQENSLSLLLGDNPGPIPRGKPLTQLSAPAIPAGLPSSLLERRPDILQAEQALISANASIGAARAQYFPSISLTGMFGAASTALSGLWTGPARIWSFAGAIAQPIFTGGAITGSVRTAEAQQQEALFSYEQAIQSAFADVEDALVGVARVRDQLQATNRRVEALAQYASLARDLYEGGYTSYPKCSTPSAVCSMRSFSSRSCRISSLRRSSRCTRRSAMAGPSTPARRRKRVGEPASRTA